MIADMISSNSLAAFTAEVSRSAGIPASAQAPRPANSVYGTQIARPAAPAQRPLDSVPPAPTQTLPRGSLLDLRV